MKVLLNLFLVKDNMMKYGMLRSTLNITQLLFIFVHLFKYFYLMHYVFFETRSDMLFVLVSFLIHHAGQKTIFQEDIVLIKKNEALVFPEFQNRVFFRMTKQLKISSFFKSS